MNQPYTLLIPKRFLPMDPDDTIPWFFLAGPIHGGDDWQANCFGLLQKHLSSFVAAVPYYIPPDQSSPLYPYVHPGEQSRSTIFARQLDWERDYISVASSASRKGCLIFWIPCESKTAPRKGGHYANDTLGELARASKDLQFNPDYRVVVGVEQGVYSRGTMERNWMADQVEQNRRPFLSTLEETVIAAVEMSARG